MRLAVRFRHSLVSSVPGRARSSASAARSGRQGRLSRRPARRARRARRESGRRSRPPARRSRRPDLTAAQRPSSPGEITRSGATNGTFGSPRSAREERVHRDLDPRRQHPARELARGRDDVEVRRGAEVDDHAWRAMAFARGDGVRDPVRADLARIVVANRHSGRHARPEHEQLHSCPPLREALVFAHELRHR